MPRPHLYMLLQDAEGNLQAGAQVRVLQPGTNNSIVVPMYGSDGGSDLIANPFIADIGVVNLYFDDPIRVRIAFQVEGSAEQYIEDIDVGNSGGEDSSSHPGLGTNSVRVGENADASGTGSTSTGVNASASGSNSVAIGTGAISSQASSTAMGAGAVAGADQSVAVGRESVVAATGGTAVGNGAEARQNFTTAIGHESYANATGATALGSSASSTHQNSTAVGYNSSTTDTNQIVLGDNNITTYVPGVMMLRSADSSNVEIRVNESGALYSTWNVASNISNLLPLTDAQFTGGVGTWAGTGTTVSITNDADISPSPVLTMDNANDGNSMKPDAVTVSEDSRYIGQAWLRTSASFVGLVKIRFLDGSDVLIGSETTTLEVPASPNEWIKVSTRGVAPAGAVTAELVVESSGGASTPKIYVLYAGLYQET